jgi:hypothetical protein
VLVVIRQRAGVWGPIPFCMGECLETVKGIDLAFVRLNRQLGGHSISSKLDRVYRCEMRGPPASGGWCRACGGRVPECCSGQAFAGLKVIAMPFMQ